MLAGSQSLGTVFGLKNSRVAAGAAGPLCSGKILGVAAVSLGAISEDAGRQLDQLIDIASERRHVLDLIVRDDAVDGSGLALQ